MTASDLSTRNQPLGCNQKPRFAGPATMMRLPVQVDAAALDACGWRSCGAARGATWSGGNLVEVSPSHANLLYEMRCVLPEAQGC